MYDYVPGKVDWLARGRPAEGTDAGKPTAGRLAQRDIARCAPDETVGVARERAAKSGNVCVVVNAEGVVFGILRAKQFAADEAAIVATVMRTGPSTFRPNVAVKEMAEYMNSHDLDSAPVTNADGRLVGLLFRDVAVKAAESDS